MGSMKFPILLALALLSGLAFAACSPAPCAYGQGPCSSNGDCVPGLVCDNGLCNQPPALCDNMPQPWQNPQVTSGNGSPAGSPYDAAMNQQQGTGGASVRSTSEFYRQGWFSDWNALGVLGVMVSVVIIALAAMIGHAFNLTEVKAFAKTEMMQAVVSLLLIAGLMGLVKFFDIVAIEAIDSMKLPVACVNAEPCYLTAAKEYLTSVQDVANQYSQNSLRESYERMRVAMRGMNMQFNIWQLAFAGANSRLNAGETIQAERAGSLFEATAKLMVSLYAQKYFLEVVSFGIAPVLLLLGIIMRTFFFTRKLGGLLLAIAISLFIVYPLTFTFAWFTLNVTVYGERSIASADSSCPMECTARYPVAFYTNSSGSIIQFETMQDILRAGINSSNWNTGNVGNGITYPGLVACRNLSNIGIGESAAPPACPECPDYCREVPFPSLPGCNITKCSTCNAGCKIMRQRYDCPSQCSRSECSTACLTAQPVENKCYYRQNDNNALTLVPANLSVSCAACETCPNWCKIVFKNSNGQYEITNNKEAPCQVPACLPAGTSMADNDGNIVNGVCPMQCLYVAGILGSDNTCDALCTDHATGTVCPNFCRVQNLSSMGAYDITQASVRSLCEGAEFSTACFICPDSCKVPAVPESAYNNPSLCAPYPQSASTMENCTSCPPYCRFTDYADYRNFSNGFMNSNASTIPGMCGNTAILGQNCSGPTACNGLCKALITPVLCEKYNSSAVAGEYCNMCPEETRGLTLVRNTAGGATESTPPALSPAVISGCRDAVCSPTCKQTMNLSVPAECLAYGQAAPAAQNLCNLCPEEVRGLSLHHVNSGGGEQTLSPLLAPSIGSGCSSSSCAPYCQRPITAEVPNYTSNPACRDISPAVNTQTRYNDAIIYGSGTSMVPLQFQPISGTASIRVDAEIVPDSGTQFEFNDAVIHGSGTSVVILGETPTPGTSVLTMTAQIVPNTGVQSAYSDSVIHGSGTPVFALSNTPTPGTGTLTVSADIVPGTSIAVFLNGISLGSMSASPRTWSGLSNFVAGSNSVGLSSQNASTNITNVSISTSYAIPNAISVTVNGVWMGNTTTSPRTWYPSNLVAGSNSIAYASQNAGNNITNTTIATDFGIPNIISVTVNGVFLGNTTTSPRTWSGLTNLVEGSNSIAFSNQNPGSNITNTTITYSYVDEYNCSQCPIACRVNFAQGNWLDPSCNVRACTANCSASCKATAPPASLVRKCADYSGASIDNCRQCPTRCRLVMSNDTWLDQSCNISACNDPNCEVECKADSSGMVPLLCLGYKGNGPVDWNQYGCYGGGSCGSYQAFSCGGIPAAPGPDCPTYGTEQGCNSIAGCGWDLQECRQHSECYVGFQSMPWDVNTPISSRAAPYNNPANCQQCPENCRVAYSNGGAYTGGCDSIDPSSPTYVDCTVGSCAMGCRATIQTPAAPPSTCMASDPNSNSCFNCPALCRRFDPSMPPNGSVFCDPVFCAPDKCIDGCRLPNPPTKMCDSCVECPSDCLYSPPTRSDCTEYCSEEALAGPINTGPQDFIKKLPGAYGKEDAKGVGVLMLPALVLPLFGLVMVIAFIRVLSPLLGGDIEIPGIGRII